MDIKTINEQIELLAKSEKITKALLGELSRTILAYVYLTGDVTPVNRLLEVLTPMNKRTAVLYFKEFLAFRFNDDTMSFKKKDKKVFDKKNAIVVEFLLDDDNNIWTWAEDNVKIEAKEVDWAKRLTSDFKKALEDGFAVDDIMDILQAVCDEADEGVVLDLDEAA